MENKIIELKEKGLLDEVGYFHVIGVVYDVKAALKQMINDWEATLPVDDKTLYSLGLRRAMDLITGVTATDPEKEESTDD